MKLHGNARTCPNSRRLLVGRVIEEGWSVSAAAAAAGISERTAYRWLRRWREQGREGLVDRSSRPLRSPTQLPAAKVQAIKALRKLRMTASEIAEVLVTRALDGLAVAEADRAGQALPFRAAGATEPL